MGKIKKEIKTRLAPQPLANYSQGIIVDKTIYVAGQGPLNVMTGKIPVGIEAQTRQVLKNIGYILEAGGTNFSNIIKFTAHLQNLSDFEVYNNVYKEFFFEPPYPVRTTVQSVLPNILVEIDVIATI